MTTTLTLIWILSVKAVSNQFSVTKLCYVKAGAVMKKDIKTKRISSNFTPWNRISRKRINVLNIKTLTENLIFTWKQFIQKYVNIERYWRFFIVVQMVSLLISQMHYDTETDALKVFLCNLDLLMKSITSFIRICI